MIINYMNTQAKMPDAMHRLSDCFVRVVGQTDTIQPTSLPTFDINTNKQRQETDKHTDRQRQ